MLSQQILILMRKVMTSNACYTYYYKALPQLIKYSIHILTHMTYHYTLLKGTTTLDNHACLELGG